MGFSSANDLNSSCSPSISFSPSDSPHNISPKTKKVEVHLPDEPPAVGGSFVFPAPSPPRRTRSISGSSSPSGSPRKKTSSMSPNRRPGSLRLRIDSGSPRKMEKARSGTGFGSPSSSSPALRCKTDEPVLLDKFKLGVPESPSNNENDDADKEEGFWLPDMGMRAQSMIVRRRRTSSTGGMPRSPRRSPRARHQKQVHLAVEAPGLACESDTSPSVSRENSSGFSPSNSLAVPKGTSMLGLTYGESPRPINEEMPERADTDMMVNTMAEYVSGFHGRPKPKVDLPAQVFLRRRAGPTIERRFGSSTAEHAVGVQEVPGSIPALLSHRPGG